MVHLAVKRMFLHLNLAVRKIKQNIQRFLSRSDKPLRLFCCDKSIKACKRMNYFVCGLFDFVDADILLMSQESCNCMKTFYQVRTPPTPLCF